MKSYNHTILIVLVVLIAGCTLPTAKEQYYNYERSALLKQASFDLNCPENKLKEQVLTKDYNNVGITGCGKRVKYKYVYRVGWIANTMSR